MTTEYVTENYFAGGIANYLQRVSLALKKMGHDPEIIVGSDKDEDFIDQGIIVHRVNIHLSGENSEPLEHQWVSISRILNKRLEKLHEQDPYDIAQYSNWMATGLFRSAHIPSVTRISSFQPLLFRNPNYSGKIEITTPEDKLELSAIKKSDAVFGPSFFLADVIKDFSHKEVKVIETPFEIEIKNYDFSIYDEYLKDKKYLLYFGRISESKGCIEIADIAYDVLKNNPDTYIVFAGDNCPFGETTVIDYARSKAGEFGEKVIHIPAIRHELLYPIIKNSYAVILPSRVDNFPNTCLEAMGHGKIVIGTRGASFEQLIKDGENGFLVEINNSRELLQKITHVLELDPRQKKEIEAKALERILQLNPKNTVSELLDFYKLVIKNNSKPDLFTKVFTDYLFKIALFAGNKLKRIINLKKNKLVMTLLVRDEVDIIKYNIDYHISRGVDFIIATDNGSIDGTRDVLLKYQDMGILHLIDEASKDYSQAEWVNRMSKIAFEKYQPDIIFHCDADEFWCPKSGNLKNELMKESADVLIVNLINVLLEDKNGDEIFPQDAKYAMIKPIETDNFEEDSKKQNLYFFRYQPKVMFKMKDNSIEVSQGNHSVVGNNKALQSKISEDIKIYHFPVRGRRHFFQKVINGGKAYSENKKLSKSAGWHWRRWFEAYKSGTLFDEYKKLAITKERAKEMKKAGMIEDFNFKKFLIVK
jgi:glycosyltransferase involved in cell wall biosynthesis